MIDDGLDVRWYDTEAPARWDGGGLDEERRWLARPPGREGTVPIGDTGVGEIKPHTTPGIKAGLKQLRGRKEPGTRVLITYTPVDTRDRRVPTGQAPRIAVQAAAWTDNASIPVRADQVRWTRLATEPLPTLIAFPAVDDGGFFGAAVEPRVRDLFERKVVRPAGRTPRPRTGGAAPGPDAVWNELAAFYAELAGEVGDPWLADLAEALAVA